MLLPEFGNLPQYMVLGDTFPLGNKLDKNYVFIIRIITLIIQILILIFTWITVDLIMLFFSRGA